jgi:hypothetical protein
VQLVEGDGKLLDHVPDDGQDQGGSDPLEHAVEGSADSVIVEPGQVALGEAEQFGREESGPFRDAIDGLACEEQIGDQDQECGDGREFGARVVVGEMVAEEPLQLHSVEDSLEQGQGADFIGA